MQPSPTHRNIRTICELEKTALTHRSLSARIGDLIATHAGRMWFIVLHVVWFAGSMAVNMRNQGHAAFDPFPFSFLTMIVSLESIFLSLFILMSQNRSSLQADQRDHLDTKMLQMLQALCAHHKLPISNDPEITAMAKPTELHEVLTDLKDNLPGEEA